MTPERVASVGLEAPAAAPLDGSPAEVGAGLTANGTSPRWLDPEEQRIWRTYLLGSARLTERMDAGLRPFGLDLPEYEILVALSEHPERRLRMAELADAVHQSRSRLTHTITRMEKAALIERTTCPNDRRGVWANLTDEGLALLERAAPGHVETVRRNFVEAISASDYRALGRAFEVVLGVDQG